MKTRLLVLLVTAICFAQTGYRTAEGAAAGEKISFDLRVVVEGSHSETLTEATIEGPVGTDFDIALNTKGFEMKAGFLTDPVGDTDSLVRIQLETKRFYGLSPNGLPLYEEDSQEHTIRVATREAVVLLPFGRNGNGDTLKIEILPQRITAPFEDAEKLKIEFLKNLTSGEILINARKIPHNFEIEAEVQLSGTPVTKGETAALFRKNEAAKLSGALDLVLDIEIEEFSRSRPTDLVSVTFGLKDKNGTMIANGRGISETGGEFRYPLEQKLGKGYELVFRVKEKQQ